MEQTVQLRVANLAIDMRLDFPVAEVNRFVRCRSPFEPELVHALLKILRLGDVVIDGGASIGCVSLVMAALVGDHGKVFAFEPAPESLVVLGRNVMLNAVQQIVTICDRPLWSSEEMVTLHLSSRSVLEHCLAELEETSGSVKTMAATIDMLGVKPRLIKLDVEGSEIAALKGARRTIVENGTYVVCELNQWSLKRFGETSDGLRAFVKDSFNYDTYLLTDFHPYPVLLPEGVKVTSNKTPNFNALMATQEMIAAAYPILDYDAPLEYI